MGTKLEGTEEGEPWVLFRGTGGIWCIVSRTKTRWQQHAAMSSQREGNCETPLRRVARRRDALTNTVTPMEQVESLIEKRRASKIIRYYYTFSDNFNYDCIRKFVRQINLF